jgi:hypothetical protein
MILSVKQNQASYFLPMSIVDLPDSASFCLNNEMQNIHYLAKSWLIDFNPNKHESVTFSRKYKRSTP